MVCTVHYFCSIPFLCIFSHELGLHEIFTGFSIDFYLEQIGYNPNGCLAFLIQLQTTSKAFCKALANPFLRLSGAQSKTSHVNLVRNGLVIGKSLQRSPPKKLRTLVF